MVRIISALITSTYKFEEDLHTVLPISDALIVILFQCSEEAERKIRIMCEDCLLPYKLVNSYVWQELDVGRDGLYQDSFKLSKELCSEQKWPLEDTFYYFYRRYLKMVKFDKSKLTGFAALTIKVKFPHMKRSYLINNFLVLTEDWHYHRSDWRPPEFKNIGKLLFLKNSFESYERKDRDADVSNKRKSKKLVLQILQDHLIPQLAQLTINYLNLIHDFS